MADLCVYCFGNFELFLEAAPLPKPATLKAQSLLTYLLRHDQRPISREFLMTLFWGERPCHRARRSLSTALWQIRRCLPQDDLIQADNQTVQWQGDCWLDVAVFEQLAESGKLA
jgi:DNA-binding SARP family transcriptional activator